MNSAQRREVRQNLSNQGFSRVAVTGDYDGTGDYAETWSHPEGPSMLVTWGPRTSDDNTGEQGEFVNPGGVGESSAV